MLYLCSTYDSNSFDPISVTSYPMILVQPRGFCVGDDLQILVGVSLQIILFTVWKIRQVAVDEILNLRHLMIKRRIHTLLEDDNLDVCISIEAVSIILDLLFTIWIGSSRILTVSTFLPLVNFWMDQNSTFIGSLSVLLNSDGLSAKKLLIWHKIDKVRDNYFFKSLSWSFFLLIDLIVNHSID